MTRKRKQPASRNILARRWTLGVLLAAAGLAGGALLGTLVVGGGLRGGDRTPSFADLSANPDALVADHQSQSPCLDCADSYGASARLRAERTDRMDEPFRELGKVDVDAAPVAEAADDYRYGGRFPDPEPPMVMVSPVAVPPPPETSPVPSTPPPGATVAATQDPPSQ